MWSTLDLHLCHHQVADHLGDQPDKTVTRRPIHQGQIWVARACAVANIANPAPGNPGASATPPTTRVSGSHARCVVAGRRFGIVVDARQHHLRDQCTVDSASAVTHLEKTNKSKNHIRIRSNQKLRRVGHPSWPHHR